jgi:isopenicillin-N N-acyltransferase-like protein
MKRNENGFAFLLLCFILIIARQNMFSQATEQLISKNKEVPVIELSGNGYQRGLQHGNVLKKEIAEVFKKWKENIQLSTNLNVDSVISMFYRATNFEPAIKKWTPELFDELRGISKSSGQSFKDVYCFQLVDEFWVYLDKLQNPEYHHCSGIGIAATNSHPAYIAQNMDLENFMNGYQVLFHISSYNDEPEQYLPSCAGLIALNGINSNGIGVCVNTLMQLEASSDGLPVACVIRGILAKKDGVSALKFIKTIKHASGQNYIIGTVDSVYDFEASANKVVRFLPDGNNRSLVYHTNHPFSNDDIKPWYVESLKRILSGEAKDNNSFIRFTALKNRLTLPDSKISDNLIKETLRSKDNQNSPICRTYKNGEAVFTFSSVILTLGKSPSIQLTNGSPDQSEYVLHSFKSKK